MAKKAVATFKKGDGRTYSKVIKMVKSPKTVMDLVKQYFPNLTVVVIPELQTSSETTALLVAPSVMGQKTNKRN